MKQVGAIKVIKFESFSEMLEWLKGDWENRSIHYQNCQHQLSVFLDYNKETGKHDKIGELNVDTFAIVNDPYSDDPQVDSLEEFFDENDKPLDDEFAKAYDIKDFTGEEYSDVE